MLLDYRGDGRNIISKGGWVEQACTRLLVCVAAGDVCVVRTTGCWCVWRAVVVCEVLCGCHGVGVCGGWRVCAR